MSPAEKQPRKGPKWLSELAELVKSIQGILLIVGGLVAGGGVGWVTADAGVSPDTARHIADSTARAQIAPLAKQIDGIQQENRAAFGALMEALPAFKKAVEERGQANADAARKKAETDTLLTNLTERK